MPNILDAVSARMVVIGICAKHAVAAVSARMIASGICIEAVATLGLHLTMQEYADRYAGNPVAEIWRMVERDGGKPLPDGFSDLVDKLVTERFNKLLAPIPGVRSVLENLHKPR